MALVLLDDICVTLTANLSKTDVVLPISNSDKAILATALGTNHSYLTLPTNLGTEVVRVSHSLGVVSIARGQNSTTAVAASAGKCLCFKYNKSVLDEYILGIQQPCTPTITSTNLKVTPPVAGQCNWQVDLTDAFVDQFNDCCGADPCSTCVLPNGTYENATITIINGKVCGVSNGRNIVYTGGSCCGCADPI